MSIAIYSKNIQLYKDVIELCKQNSIDVSNFSWSCLLGDKITLFYDVVRDELTQYISNAYNLASLLQVTLEANNFKLFKRIYNSNNGDKCSIYDKKRWLCAAVTNFELFEKLRRDSILTLKISAVMWKDIIERIIIQGGIDQLLAFAIFSKEQGYFVATGLSDKILVAAKMAPKGYMYLKKFDSFGVPNDISNLIFAYVELPYYRNAAAYKHYFGKESVCSEESIKDLDFLEFDDYMPQVRHQYQDLTLMPPAKNNESDKVCTVVALQQTTRLNPYVID